MTTVKELREVLAQYSDDVVVMGDYAQHAIRDMVSLDGKFEGSFLEFTGRHVSPHTAYPHLTDEECLKQREAILDGLAESYRPFGRGFGKAFTTVHGDMRLYDPSLGSQATCYGTAYDPRVWKELETEGLIRFFGERFNGERCDLTEKGIEVAKDMDRKRPKFFNPHDWPLNAETSV